MEYLSLVGFIFDVIGKVMVALTALLVHHRFRQEHKVDEKVFRVMRWEQTMGVIGVVFIVVGFLLQLPSKI